MDSTIKVQIGDKDVGFKFTMKTFELFSEVSGVEFGDMISHFSKKPYGSFVKLFWAAHSCYHKGEISVTEYDVDDWIDSMEQKAFQSIWDTYTASLQSVVEKISKEDKKKQ